MASEKYKDFLIELFFNISQESRFEWMYIKDLPDHLITINYHTEGCNTISIEKRPGKNNEETKYTYLYENEHSHTSLYKDDSIEIDRETCKNLILWFLNEYGIPTDGSWWYHPQT